MQFKFIHTTIQIAFKNSRRIIPSSYEPADDNDPMRTRRVLKFGQTETELGMSFNVYAMPPDGRPIGALNKLLYLSVLLILRPVRRR